MIGSRSKDKVSSFVREIQIGVDASTHPEHGFCE